MNDYAAQLAREVIDGHSRPLSLENYVETTKQIKLDRWQKDICRRLEEAFWIAQYAKFKDKFVKVPAIGDGRAYQISPSGLPIDQAKLDEDATKGSRAAIHAPPQFGKSIIISQCYPAWILGFDPLHRFRLATYNMLHSARFSRVVKHLMASAEHQSLFPDPAGHLPIRTKAQEWSTNARLNHPDGQASFAALGLQSGFVGTGYDTLLMDDPYKSAEEAMSDVKRDSTWRFWTDTARVRANEQSNVFIMFHRYHQDDMGGRAIGSGEFDLWRYAAEADGVYEDEESGLKFQDPMGRHAGEVLSPRFGPGFYQRQKQNEQVWYSQFQGRPSAQSGKLFNVGLLKPCKREDVPPILHWVRAWDNAATEGGGAYTAGALMGIAADETVYVFDMQRKQVGTAERQRLQESTAEKDGKLVQIHVPQDPGSAGKDVAFEFQQEMAKAEKGYLVVVNKVSGTKEMRAYPFSKAVNSQKVYLVLNQDGSEPAWHKPLKSELRYFPLSTYKDQADCLSDGYSHLVRLFYRGLVIKSASDFNLVHRSLFVKRTGSDKIQQHWEVAAAARIAPDSSKPSGYCITARAAENARMGEAVFIVAAARMYVADPIKVLEALRDDLLKHCALGIRHPHVIWINKDADEVLQVTAQKMDLRLSKFLDDATAGIPETNYYFQKIPGFSPFYSRVGTSRCHAIVDDDQFEKKNIRDERGMLSLRQDWASWSYTERGEVQPWAGIVLDCVRMTMYKFALSATILTPEERRLAKLAPEHQPEAVRAKLGTDEFVEAVFAQEHALRVLRMQEEEERAGELRDARNREVVIGRRAVTHRYTRRA